ncbi:MAG: MATE family efflux transporter [Candidatus Binatia bacterium]
MPDEAQSVRAHAARTDAAAALATGPEALLGLPPLQAIARLALPTTLVMLVAATSNVLYTYFVSRLGADAIAAVSLVFPVSILAITAMAGGIGAGVSSAVARALGAGHRNEAARIAEQGLSLAVLLGLAFGLLILVAARPFFALLGGRDVALDAATIFARVLFGGAAITFTGGMLDSILRGEGNVRVPAIWSTTSLVLQMAFTPLFMFGFGWGLPGAAVATLSAQMLATLPRARYVFGGHGALRLVPRPQPIRRTPLREILRVGVPASLATILSQLGVMVLTGVLGHLGQAHLAAYGLGTRLDFLLLSFAYGVGAALLTLVGMASGARRPEQVLGYVGRAAAIAFLLLGVPGVVLWARPALWVDLFTTDPAIRDVSTSYFRIIGPSYPFLGVSMTLAFAFQGLGRAGAALVWMAVRTVGVLGVALLCTQLLGLADRAVFTTVAIANVVSAFALGALFLRLWHRQATEASRSS